jgi:lipoprotein-anchoring transpeptidase ErfK/SrfK
MNKFFPNGRIRFFPTISLFLLCGSLGLAFFFFTSSPASALIFGTVTPTRENLFAHVDIPKATYTPAPLFTPTDMPIAAPMATETPGVMAMEVVADTPTSVYIPPTNAPVAQQAAAQPASGYSGSKYILVDISEQHMYVYEGTTLVYSFVASTGMNNATSVGTFAVQDKIPNAYGSTWNIWMPDWLGIYWAGNLENGIHALPILSNGNTLWAGFLGRPISYGCVVLGSYEAKLLYDWADVGTPVEIRW